MVRNGSVKDILIGTNIQERYRVLRRIGEGGMGVVYEAEHLLIGRRFALKTLSPHLAQDPEVVARFHREARAAAAIGDKHIIEVNDMGRLDNGTPYIVLELLQGNDLGDELEKAGPLPISRAIHIATQCCKALGKAHVKDIVHRDIKPDNIFLDISHETKDFVKILDFGISKVKEAALGLNGSLKTKTGAAIGTPYYMSPEQAVGDASVDGRTDIYAVGVVLFRMLIGRVPFYANTLPMLMVDILHSPPPSLVELRSDIPLELERVIHRAMAKSPSDRFNSMEEFALALSSFTTLSGEAKLTDSGLAFCKTVKAKTTPKVWESTRELILSRSPTQKVLGLSVGGVVLIVLALLTSRALDRFQQTSSSETIVVPEQKGQTNAAVTPQVQPVSTSSYESVKPTNETPPSSLPAGLAPLRSTLTKEYPTDLQAEKSSVLKRSTKTSRRKESVNPSKRIGSIKTTTAKEPNTVAPVENTEPETRIRSVTLLNQRLANVNVTLECGDASKTFSVSAKSFMTASIPQKSCKVFCKGIGNPRCPITLNEGTRSLEIK